MSGDTPREPDRFDKQAEKLTQGWGGATTLGQSRINIAAAIRAEHEATLERAAHDLSEKLLALRDSNKDSKARMAYETAARHARALKEPAAPAAVPDCPHCGSSRSRVQEAGAAPPEFRECIDCGVLWQDPARREPPAPAAETGKAPEPEQCDRDVFEYGATVAVLAIGKQQAESLCAGLRVVTGWKWDWFYAAGREVIRCLCPPAPAPAQGAEAPPSKVNAPNAKLAAARAAPQTGERERE